MERNGSSNLIVAVLVSVIRVMVTVLTYWVCGPTKLLSGYVHSSYHGNAQIPPQFFLSDATLWGMKNLLMESFQKSPGRVKELFQGPR